MNNETTYDVASNVITASLLCGNYANAGKLIELVATQYGALDVQFWALLAETAAHTEIHDVGDVFQLCDLLKTLKQHRIGQFVPQETKHEINCLIANLAQHAAVQIDRQPHPDPTDTAAIRQWASNLVLVANAFHEAAAPGPRALVPIPSRVNAVAGTLYYYAGLTSPVDGDLPLEWARLATSFLREALHDNPKTGASYRRRKRGGQRAPHGVARVTDELPVPYAMQLVEYLCDIYDRSGAIDEAAALLDRMRDEYGAEPDLQRCEARFGLSDVHCHPDHLSSGPVPVEAIARLPRGDAGRAARTLIGRAGAALVGGGGFVPDEVWGGLAVALGRVVGVDLTLTIRTINQGDGVAVDPPDPAPCRRLSPFIDGVTFLVMAAPLTTPIQHVVSILVLGEWWAGVPETVTPAVVEAIDMVTGAG